MKKILLKYRVFLVIAVILLCLSIFLICYFNIPRISYAFDETTNSYYVDRVYGNAKSYTIKEEIKGKPVTAIGVKAFMDKTHLESVYFGEGIQRVERLSFSGCVRLRDIDLSNVDHIGRNAFADCHSIEKLDLYASYLDGGAFYGCSQLRQVSLSNTIIIGSYAFAQTMITSITLPESLSELGIDAFYQCDSLKEIKVLSKKWLKNPYLLSLEQVKIVE